MLKEKKELVEYLRSRCNSLVFNQEKLNEITTQIEAENNVPTGITTDIIAGRTNMEEDNEFLLSLICNKIKPDKAKEFFTENEISFYSAQQYERDEFEFPIDIQCIQVAPDQWIGATDVNFLIELRVEGADITSNGIFCEAVKCIKQVNDASVDYDIYDKSGKVLFLVSILGY